MHSRILGTLGNGFQLLSHLSVIVFNGVTGFRNFLLNAFAIQGKGLNRAIADQHPFSPQTANTIDGQAIDGASQFTQAIAHHQIVRDCPTLQIKHTIDNLANLFTPIAPHFGVNQRLKLTDAIGIGGIGLRMGQNAVYPDRLNLG